MLRQLLERRTLLATTAGILLGLSFGMGSAKAEPQLVAITSIVDHPALNAVRDGVKDTLEKQGYTADKVKVVFQNAQGQPATAAQIARKFVGDKPVVIVAISTPSAQAAMAATKSIPIVFSAVSDPVAAKLVNSAEKPDGNVTGASDRSPIAEQIDLIREMTPNAKNIGIIYNPGEANSVVNVTLFKDAAVKKGVTTIDATATKSSDVQAAARALVGKADVIYVPTDNTIISALESAIGVANAAKIPLHTGDTDSVARGAIASLGVNYYQLGVHAGEQVIRILKGDKIADIPVVFGKGTDLYVSKKTAALIGVTIPDTVLKRSLKIIE